MLFFNKITFVSIGSAVVFNCLIIAFVLRFGEEVEDTVMFGEVAPFRGTIFRGLFGSPLASAEMEVERGLMDPPSVIIGCQKIFFYYNFFHLFICKNMFCLSSSQRVKVKVSSIISTLICFFNCCFCEI